MTQLLIDSNERMTLRLAEIETESHRKARATQMAIATLFSTMMANKAPRTSEWMDEYFDELYAWYCNYFLVWSIWFWFGFFLLPHACAFLERLPIIYKNIFLHIKVTRKCKDISQYRWWCHHIWDFGFHYVGIISASYGLLPYSIPDLVLLFCCYFFCTM